MFLVIGAVSASDVMDVSNNPNNDDSSIQVSEESDNALSNESISVSNSLDDVDDDDSYSPESSKISSKVKSASSTTAKASASKTTKVSTNLKVSGTSFYSGQSLVVTLKDKNSKALSGQKILFKFTSLGKTYTKTTDKNGQAKITLNAVGTLKVVVSFAGKGNYSASSYSGSLKVSKSGSGLTVSSTTVALGTPLVVTLKNKKTGALLSNQKVKFTLKKNSYVRTTDSKGQAKLNININKPFNVTISYGGSKALSASSITKTINPTKCGLSFTYSASSVKYGHSLTITLKNKVTAKAVSGKKLVVKYLSKSYTKTTNSKGQVSIPIYGVGDITLKTSYAGDDVYKSASSSKKIKGVKDSTKLSNSRDTLPVGDAYVVTLKDSNGKVLSNKKVVLNFSGRAYTKTTNSKGQASLTIIKGPGTYSMVVSYGGSKYYAPTKISKKVKMTNSIVSIANVIKAATTLRAHVDYTNRLNKSYVATINGLKYSTDELAYMMAQAVVKINKGTTSGYVNFKNLTGTYTSKGATINGNLMKAKYVSLANTLISSVNKNNKIPANISTNLGKMEANLYTFGLAKALQFYGEEKYLPNYLIMKSSYIKGSSSSSLSQNAKILNWKEAFNATEFEKYLKTGGKSALNSAIISKAKSLTSGLSSVKAKANAIFKFVRDEVTYSYYSDSKKGAAKTLSSKSANCCDKANLIVAMCRSVGIYARYSHAQGCTFSSGLVTGHVWAQIYDTSSQTWYSADATSYRNSLGTINNWNVNKYSSAKNYVLIPF